jgi:hypothetical protein
MIWPNAQGNPDAGEENQMSETEVGGSGSPACSVAGISDLIDALRFYATAQTYHAVTVLADRPAGEFAEDFSEDHGDKYYNRAMPGKLARETLTRLGIPW